RDPHHRTLPPRVVRLRRRRRPLGAPSAGVRIPPAHGPLPAVPPATVTRGTAIAQILSRSVLVRWVEDIAPAAGGLPCRGMLKPLSAAHLAGGRHEHVTRSRGRIAAARGVIAARHDGMPLRRR